MLRDGYYLSFSADPTPLTSDPPLLSYSHSHPLFQELTSQVQALLAKGAIEQTDFSLGFYSRLFLAPKQNGDWRPVIWNISASSPTLCARWTEWVLRLTTSLGLILNLPKCDLTPSQQCCVHWHSVRAEHWHGTPCPPQSGQLFTTAERLPRPMVTVIGPPSSSCVHYARASSGPTVVVSLSQPHLRSAPPPAPAGPTPVHRRLQ